MVPTSVKFSFIAFWDDFAWVAGTTQYNSTGQGSTIPIAIDSLKSVLEADAILAKRTGQTPFEVLYKRQLPLKAFVPRGNEEPVPEGVPDKGIRYKGDFELEIP